MMMNNIKGTFCMLEDLTQEQLASLIDAMPSGQYEFFISENAIGASERGNWGTWDIVALNRTIVTYTEMMQLLGKDMNKQTAQEQMAVMQIEMDKLKAIIDKPEAKPEAKTGRVMSAADLKQMAHYWVATYNIFSSTFFGDKSDLTRIDVGMAFHDKESAETYLEYLKLEQELRRAQAADGGVGEYKIVLEGVGHITSTNKSVYVHRLSFNTELARDKFKNTHTDEQLTLLIRGV
jgi:hypothetical protein